MRSILSIIALAFALTSPFAASAQALDEGEEVYLFVEQPIANLTRSQMRLQEAMIAAEKANNTEYDYCQAAEEAQDALDEALETPVVGDLVGLASTRNTARANCKSSADRSETARKGYTSAVAEAKAVFGTLMNEQPFGTDIAQLESKIAGLTTAAEDMANIVEDQQDAIDALSASITVLSGVVEALCPNLKENRYGEACAIFLGEVDEAAVAEARAELERLMQSIDYLTE